MLETIKALIGINDNSKDTLLNTLIDLATKKVFSYCNIDTLPIALEPVVIDIVIIQYNKLGSEGLSSESISGVSKNFIDPIEENAKLLNRFRRVGTTRTVSIKYMADDSIL